MKKENIDFITLSVCFLGFMFWVVTWLMRT
jgi:hypothetical protein